jgi:uncharacterized protein YukE
MPEVIRGVPEDLRVSAADVEGHADELQARHTAAHGRIEAAQAGVPAAAAVALSATVAKWQEDTAVLSGNLFRHGRALRGAEVAYVATEHHSSEAINAVGAEGSAVNVGL